MTGVDRFLKKITWCGPSYKKPVLGILNTRRFFSTPWVDAPLLFFLFFIFGTGTGTRVKIVRCVGHRQIGNNVQ